MSDETKRKLEARCERAVAGSGNPCLVNRETVEGTVPPCSVCAPDFAEHVAFLYPQPLPEPVGQCPRCGTAWYTLVGRCGGCE